MVGVQRATVTLAAGALQRAGLAIFRRGLVTIPDPRSLEEAACECYRVLTAEYMSASGVGPANW